MGLLMFCAVSVDLKPPGLSTITAMCARYPAVNNDMAGLHPLVGACKV